MHANSNRWWWLLWRWCTQEETRTNERASDRLIEGRNFWRDDFVASYTSPTSSRCIFFITSTTDLLFIKLLSGYEHEMYLQAQHRKGTLIWMENIAEVHDWTGSDWHGMKRNTFSILSTLRPGMQIDEGTVRRAATKTAGKNTWTEMGHNYWILMAISCEKCRWPMAE